MNKRERARMRATLGWSACAGFVLVGGAAAWTGFADGDPDGQPADLRADGVQIGGQNNSPGAAGGNIGDPANQNNRGGDNNTVVTVGGEPPFWLSPLFDTQRNSPGAATGSENNQGGNGNVVINLGG
ncbi:hypothetical protein [Mycolicibacterium gadium]|jgi:hypothetical protein|uniref:hypothetical protein n=1 Tax=Mycolicibacterium gadium TaxID=1794 RepID=UPI002FDE5A00